MDKPPKPRISSAPEQCNVVPLSLNPRLNISNSNNNGAITSQLISAIQQNLAHQIKEAGISVPPGLITVVNSQQSSCQASTPTLHSKVPSAISVQSNEPSATSSVGPTTPKVNFIVRVINPIKKKEYETLVLREIPKDSLLSPMDLKEELYKQFGVDLVSPTLSFAIGYVKGSSYVSIRTPEDMKDVWKMPGTIRGNTVLWCEKTVKKKGSTNASDYDEESEDEFPPQSKRKKTKVSALDQKNERIDNLVEKLCTKHQGKFTNIQFRLWAEVIDSGKWKSLDKPPVTLGVFSREKRTTPMVGLTNAVTEMAKAMSQTHQHTQSSEAQQISFSASGSSSDGVSPAKLANLRSSYLQQLRELHSLYECGAINEGEFIEQKSPVLEQLKKMTPRS